MHPTKRSNRRSLPALALNHRRNVSTSSDETLVWSPSGQSSSASPAISQLDQELQDAAERAIREKKAKEIRALKRDVRELRREKDGQTQRAEGLQTDLALSETSRQMSLNMAIQYYKKQGNPSLVDLENLTERVDQMRLEIRERDDLIWERDELIEALGRDVVLYADQGHWHLMQRRFLELQQQYERMPEEFGLLERNYGDLQDDHVDLTSRFRNLEADLTVQRAQLSQVQDERDQFEYDASVAKQQSENAVSRYRRMEAERNEILDQKAESEEQAGAKERLLADLASRMLKRTIILSAMLDDFEVETYDDELVSLCQLAYEHLGINAQELYKDFEVAKARAKRDGEAGEERDESRVPEVHAGNASGSASASDSDHQEPTIRLAGPSTKSAVTESPNTYDARRRREVAAAEEAILGPLGLGFEDGSPTLKTIPKSSKASRVTGLVPTSPETPRKTRRGLFASGADEIDQVTPARTGGTRGIARDQWQIASDDLQELTEVFKGPRVQPIGIVSPEATEEEDGSRGDRGDSPSDSEGGAFLSPNEDGAYENDLVEDIGVSEDQETHIASSAAELEQDSSTGSVARNSSPKTPLAEGSRVFRDLGVGNNNVQQGEDAIPDLPKEAFNAPRLEDFVFGESGGAIVFTGSENEFSGLAEGAPASPSSGIFNLTSASTQASINADDPPPFEQNFNFGGSNSAVSFTASQNAPSSLPTSAPELDSAAASSVLGTSLAEDPPAVIAQVDDDAPNEEASDKKVIEEETKADGLGPNKQPNKKAKAKAKKAQEKARKTEERKEAKLKAKGPNRNQRRAASRERKAAEKKAQAEAKKAKPC